MRKFPGAVDASFDFHAGRHIDLTGDSLTREQFLVSQLLLSGATSHDSLPLFHKIDTAWPGLQTISAEPFIFMIPDFVSESECDAMIAKCE